MTESFEEGDSGSGGESFWSRLLAAAAAAPLDCPEDVTFEIDPLAVDSPYGSEGEYDANGYDENEIGNGGGGYDDRRFNTRHRGLVSSLYGRILAAVGGGDPCSGDGGGHASKLDYTVLSVVMWTLALISLVEILRHQLDKKAHNRPFFRVVLEGVYRELSTLGIVEFCIFIAHQYAKNFNVEIEQVFAKVHFLLFFTAMINAVMSVVLAIISSRISDRMWIRTENLELNHYIAIREEFDRINATLQYISDVDKLTPTQRDLRHSSRAAESMYRSDRTGLRRHFYNLKLRVRYPLLKRKRDQLLVTVRFHELRVHFLKANNLPLKFRVSDYLKKSEVHVFKKMVHISTFAWITVASFVNLLYFLMGITAYTTSSQEYVSTAMGSIFTGLIVFFVPIAWIIERKMKWIFRRIMQLKLIDQTAHGEGEGDDSPSEESYDQDEQFHQSLDWQERGERVKKSDRLSSTRRDHIHGNDFKQLDLFWGGDPHYIIGAFQFMQLAYAIAMSILLIFWENISWITFRGFFVIVALLCYSLFVIIMAKVVPRYTLCTSLGQLVNHRRLHETMAKFKLQEARRRRRLKLEEGEIQSQLDMSRKQQQQQQQQPPHSQKEKSTKDAIAVALSGISDRAQEAGSKLLGAHEEDKKTPSKNLGAKSDSEKGSEETSRYAKLAELVQTRTQDLPAHLSPPKTAAQIRKERRKHRIKSMSDGVQLMRQFGGSMANLSLTPSSSISEAAATELMHADEDSKAASSSALFDSSTPAAPLYIPPRKRSVRHKAMSDNAALRSSAASSFFGPDVATQSFDEQDGEGSSMKLSVPTKGHATKASHKPSNVTRLSALIEDIPSRTPKAGSISVPIGREGTDFCEENNSAEDVSDAFLESGALDGSITVASEQPSEHKDTEGEKSEVLSDIPVGDDDDDTVKTDDSDGGQSDFNDVPEVARSIIEKRQEITAHNMTWASRFRLFFLSSRYRFFSGVLGTMVVFFIIGMRIEIMLVEGPNEIIYDNKNTWHLDAKSAFYWEISWLSLFILISSLSGTLFFFKGLFSGLVGHRTNAIMAVAVVSDVILSAACLCILLWSEKSRASCCQTQDGSDVCYYEFGSRLCGGLGTIEPFTSLIALRIFRFYWGNFVVEAILRWKRVSEPPSTHSLARGCIAYSGRSEEVLSEHSISHSERLSTPVTSAQLVFTQESDMPKSLENEIGTIDELWKLAISIYPDVAERYGEFSGELLQAMLRIEIVDKKGEANMAEKTTPASKAPGKVSPGVVDSVGATPGVEETALVNSIVLSNSKYAKLAPDAQGIIVSGEIGRSVRCLCHGESALSPVRDALMVQFQLDRETDDDVLNLLVNPNARLIRSMRRCERRLPPILGKWAAVDVVLTKHELVYFDARDDDGFGDDYVILDPETKKKQITVKQAMVATKGGKGLRLRDVIVGRKVLGHLELDDIEIAKVECLSPVDKAGWFRGADDAEEEEPSCYVADEYWRSSDADTTATPHQSRNQRWKLVMEHRLKLQSLQGPLYLRFFSDLEDAEKNTYDEDDTSHDHVHRNDALLWCQTIARLCGSDQLNQNLAHLGEEGSAELHDFLELIDRGGDLKQSAIRRVVSKVNTHRRAGSSKFGPVAEHSSVMGSATKANKFVEADGNEDRFPIRESVVKFEGFDEKEDEFKEESNALALSA